MKVTVRKVSHRNKLLATLQARCLPFDAPYSPKPGDLWYIAFAGGWPAGFGVARETGGGWFLARAGVLPEFRGHGLQKKLIRARLRGIKAQGGKVAYTYTMIDNPASAQSLIGCGFRPYIPAWRWVGPNINYWRRPC